MNDAVRYLGINSTKHVSVLPNVGLPQNVGATLYIASVPKSWRSITHFVEDHGVRKRGGCCGTAPEHLKAVVNAVSGVEPCPTGS